jgi:hypothetical protein
MKFAKGQSGNPKGRAKGQPTLTPALRAVLSEKGDGDKTNRRLAAERLVRLALYGDEKAAVGALKVIFDRVDGPIARELTGKDGGPVRVTFYLPENGRD